MASIPESSVLKVTEKTGLVINEYKGSFSLNVVNFNEKTENWFLKWCFLSRWDREMSTFVPSKDKRPMNAYLGDSKEKAISTLKTILAVLENYKSPPNKPNGHVEEDDVPF